MSAYRVSAGSGSAYGGEWKPSKPKDERLLGKPGEIKVNYERNGTKIETKIGKDGRAERERHHTDHRQPGKHTDPHDHKINWETPRYGRPNFESPINYAGQAPEFKQYESWKSMATIVPTNTLEENRFKTISDFEDCIIRGGEVEFVWNGIHYGVVRYGTDDKITIYEAYKPETEKVCDTPDDALEYMVSGDRLRDVITQVTVLDRTI